MQRQGRNLLAVNLRAGQPTLGRWGEVYAKLTKDGVEEGSDSVVGEVAETVGCSFDEVSVGPLATLTRCQLQVWVV